MEDLFLYLAKSSGLLVVFLAFYHLLLKRDTSFKNNRGFLLGGIIASAILPAVYFTRKIIVEAIKPNFSMTEADLPMAPVIAEEPAISVYQILFAVYFCGVLFMLGRMVLQLISLQRIIRNGKHTKKDGFKHVQIPEKIAPFSFLNFIIYNPNLHSASELDNILKHEKIHIVQWHSTDVLLANLNLIYQWFNPFAWIYLKSLQQNLEYIADSEAVKEVSCKKEYQKALLKITVENFNPALTNSFYQSFIKKRIIMLNNNSNSKNKTWKTALIFPVLLAFLLIFNVQTEAQIKTQTESTETTNSRMAGTISKDTRESGLNFLKRFFDNQNIQLEFENVQRSENGFITGITVNILNRNTNASGNFTRNNPDGINTFEIYLENGVTGFGNISTSEEKEGTVGDVLSKVGNNPLYIINGKEYTADKLDGKTIAMDIFVFIDAENAKAKYGNKGKDGVIFISKGEILDNMTSELKKIDKQNKKVNKTFLEVKKNEKPSLWEVSNNPEVSLEKNKIQVSVFSTSSATQNIQGKPLYILNGKVVEKNKIDSLEPDSIVNTTDLKGEEAVSLYGNVAHDGAIIITTRPPGTTVEVSTMKFSAGDKEERIALYHELKSKKEKALIILNGKKQPKSFDLNSIDPDDIEAINIQTGKDIVKEYGKAAKDGVIFISTEKAVKTITGTGKIIPTSMNISGNTQFSKSETKVITITGESNQINASQWGTKSNPANVNFYPQDEKPLVVVNGKEMDADFDMQSIDQESIISVNILKGENAIEEYGDKGKNGVIEIFTADKASYNSSLIPTFAKINRSTTEEGLKITRRQLKEQSNLDLNFEDIKRNKEGLITDIKITGKTKTSQASATYQNKDGIPEVFIGVRDNSIVISSNVPRK